MWLKTSRRRLFSRCDQLVSHGQKRARCRIGIGSQLCETGSKVMKSDELPPFLKCAQGPRQISEIAVWRESQRGWGMADDTAVVSSVDRLQMATVDIWTL